MKSFKNVQIFLAILVAAAFMLSMSNIAPKPWPVPDKYKNMKNAKAGVNDTEKIGKTLYDQHCKSCHGAKGAGDGNKASGLSTTMRSFATADVQKQTDGEIYYKSFIGRDEMPNFEKKIASDSDRWMIVNYIRTMKK
ncbi:MAG: c-type cytochrome [Bacteroidales bacterium]